MFVRAALCAAAFAGALHAADQPRPEAIAAHVEFLASDVLQGRDTGTIGYEVAAEYVASRFRSVGLRPPGDDYFQRFPWVSRSRDASGTTCTLWTDGDGAMVPGGAFAIEVDHDVDVENATVVRIELDDELPSLATSGDVIVLTELPSATDLRRDREAFGKLRRLGHWVDENDVRVVLGIERSPVGGSGGRPDVRPAGDDRAPRRMMPFPIVRVHHEPFVEWFDTLEEGVTTAKMDFALAPMREEAVDMKNVVGILPGSDESVADEWIIVTAHLDHIGVGTGSGDVINNGANDDASGVAGVIEIARVLAVDPPRRSVMFIALFGEERGLLGSRAYVEAPIVPLEKTIANVNLEHIGRTDDSDEPGPGQIMITGHRLSTAADVLSQAAVDAGLRHNPHELKSRQFFGASDNASFANVGIPAHTICTCFIFPDYHQPGDHWELIDYDNMSKVIGAAAEGVRRLADAESAPEWHDVRDARRYRDRR